MQKAQSEEEIRSLRKQLERKEKRIAELKRLFMKIYEDNAAGRLSDDRYEMLSVNYETEQKQLEAEVTPHPLKTLYFLRLELNAVLWRPAYR